MGRGGGGLSLASAPTVVPVAASGDGVDRQDQWRSFDNSVNAVSFGFVATAILISMFLIMAIFERFLRPRSSESAVGGGGGSGGEADMIKLDNPSPKMTVYPKGVSVLMPGEKIPTFLAHPAPPPYPPEPMFPGTQ